MKNYSNKKKFLLLTITYTVVVIILIRHFTSFIILDANNSKNSNFKNIVTVPMYATPLSNKLSYTIALSSKNKQVPTLSRGYSNDLDTNSSKKLESLVYEDDLYATNESALLESYYAKKALIKSNTTLPRKNQTINAHLPDYLMYKNVNITNLKEFLNSKNSLLVEEPYFTTILSVSKDFNLNPLVMFAITGQEQSFVPKTDKNANKIANNPFNVFYSWKKYNTSIKDASSIAARTLVNLCKNKPNNVDAFTWINRKYSEDENWSKAVRSIFKKLEGNVSYWK